VHSRVTLDGVIDVHTHMVPTSLPASAQRPDRPCIHCLGSHRARLVVDHRVLRELDSRSWDVDARIAVMDSEGVAMQVVSPMPELLTHWLPYADHHEIATCVNGAIAEMVSRRPDRFAGLGMVGLQDPDRAAKDVERLSAMGLAGVELATDAGGSLLGHERFEPFMHAADDRGMCIFVHPVRPPGTGLDSVPAADVLVGYPLQSGKAVVNLVYADVPRRYPHLKMIFSHGGGVAAPLLARCSQGWRAVASVQAALRAAPLDVARGFHFDTLVYDVRTLQYLVDTFGAAQLLVGSDFPFLLREPWPGRSLADLSIGDAEREMIRSGNARRLLAPDRSISGPSASPVRPSR
jgi:aminocarboxymuconate-semialdehyde decarboxylase